MFFHYSDCKPLELDTEIKEQGTRDKGKIAGWKVCLFIYFQSFLCCEEERKRQLILVIISLSLFHLKEHI